MFAFAFFLFVHIPFDFRVPLADALGQIGSILDRLCYFVGLTFPALSAARAEFLQGSQETSQIPCRELAKN